MKAKLRKDLLEQNEYPPLIGHDTHTINWHRHVFECEQSELLEGAEFNLVLSSPLFKHGIAFACSIDFDFID